jgi:hypothetical protein
MTDRTKYREEAEAYRRATARTELLMYVIMVVGSIAPLVFLWLCG